MRPRIRTGMTRTHYEIVADIISALPDEIRFVVADHFASKLSESFYSFNVSKFLEECHPSARKEDLLK